MRKGLCWWHSLIPVLTLFFTVVVTIISVQAQAYRLPDTGQTKCYDNEKEIPCPKPGEPFYGQDGNYQGAQPSYRDNGDGTVTDLNTGLVWQQGGDQNDWSFTWQQAIDHCDNSSLAGHSDWRLPAVTELTSLTSIGGIAAIDTNYFYIHNNWCWASTSVADQPDKAWYENFSAFGVGYPLKTEIYGSRCVRGNPLPAGSYRDNLDGSITDETTGLIWQKSDDGQSRNWQQALAYCESLDLAGYTDWRLPNYRELASIVDYSRHDPAVDPIFDAQAGYYLSSSTCANHPNFPFYAYHVIFTRGQVGWWYKTSAAFVRCVRGGRSAPVGSPTIAQSPPSGPPGTIFAQWGTGFTPNSTAAFHVKKPDGSEYDLWDQHIDGIGHFEVPYPTPWDKALGTYTWWLIDGPTGVKSNELSYEITGGSNAVLRGQVFDAATRTPLPGVAVTAAGKPATTNATGNYSFSKMPSGKLTVKVSKKNYAPVTKEVYVAPSSNSREDFWLSPSGQSGIAVTSVSTRYGGQVYFLEGFDQEVTYTASVDWAAHPRGKVRFTTSKGVHDVPATGNAASLTINIGEELQQCSPLKVKAISADLKESLEITADSTVMPNPLPTAPAPLLLTDMGDSFKYQSQYGFNMDFFDEGVDAGVIPEKIPLFGKEAFKLQFIPSVTAEVDSSGHAQVRFEWGDLDAGSILSKEWGRDHNAKKIFALLSDYVDKGRVDKRRLPKAAVAGFEINLFPYFELDAEFNEGSCSCLWGGQFGIVGEMEFSKSWPFICMAGPIPVPMYAKASLSLSMDAGIGLKNLDPLSFDGSLSMNPYARGSLGAGVDSVLAVEGWLGGGAEFGLQFPEEPTLNELSIYLNGGVTVYALLWKWENELLKWEWDLLGSSGRSILLLPDMGPIAPRLAPRNYLSSPHYARFLGGKDGRTRSLLEQGAAYTVSMAALQSTIFPYSEPTIAAGGSKLDLAWLYDNPARSTVNRTMAVWSRWNGSTWSDPKPIKDDGTADFHPDLLTLGSGAVFAAWEDEGKVMPDTAQFEDMVKTLEISVARYNPTKKVWTGAKRLTTNGILDRSPKLGGVSANNILLTWVANAANDIRGDTASPNTLWFSNWNGSKWSTPQVFATVPYGFLKYDLHYDGTNAFLVMSLDTDNDPATINDHELFLIGYAGGQWGTMQRLTDDNESDDNPHLSALPGGTVMLTWVKGGKLAASKDFAASTPVTVWDDQYSSNLADFKAADDQNGTIALVWAEPTEYSSDIYAIFYDKAFGAWGKPQRLTFDPQAEKYLAPAFSNGQNLMVVYDRTDVATEQVERRTAAGKTFAFAVPKVGLTDLYTLRYRVGGDLALDELSFVSTPLNPHPGEAVTFTVKAVNVGDKTTTNIPVAFYDGDPAGSGKEIGRATIADILKPGEASEVSVAWNLPTAKAPPGVYAVIDPDRELPDKNRNNNKVKRSLALPDLAVQPLTWSRVAENLYEVTARVINQGAVAAGATDIRFRKDGPEGELVSQQTIPKLDVFRSYDALTRITMDGNGTEELQIYAVVDEDNKITEFDEANNSASVLIEKR